MSIVLEREIEKRDFPRLGFACATSRASFELLRLCYSTVDTVEPLLYYYGSILNLFYVHNTVQNSDFGCLRFSPSRHG